MLEILIPTFNRDEFLERNLSSLLGKISQANDLCADVRILVSDNNSTDRTREICLRYCTEFPRYFRYVRNEVNLGVELNVLQLLRHATCDFVLYLGDDDYLPDGYLEYVIRVVKENPRLGFIAPGFVNVFRDGSNKRSGRSRRYRHCPPGFHAVCLMSGLAHQLSGLVYKRDGLLKSYEQADISTLYPFVYFAICSMERHASVYVPFFVVRVSQGNSKDWKYDEAGLLSEIATTYERYYAQSPCLAVVAFLSFTSTQLWRLRISSPLFFTKAIRFLLRSKKLSLHLKVYLIIGMPIVVFSSAVRKLLTKVSLR